MAAFLLGTSVVTPSARLPVRLLRYRFDTFEQARWHLHPVEGRQLLHFPAAGAALHPGQRLVLELAFDDSEQTVDSPGLVHGGDGARAAWLELFSLRTEQLRVALSSRRRRHRRLPCDEVVRVERPGRPGAVARMVDVSGGGARLAGAGGAWLAGEDVIVAPLTGQRLRGRVAWARGGELAVSFVRSDAATRMAANTLLQRAVDRWHDALEARHPALCRCTAGQPAVEPLLPRAVHRKVEGL